MLEKAYDKLKEAGMMVGMIKDWETLTALFVCSSPIMSDDDVEKIRGILGEGYTVYYNKNEHEVRVLANA